tara:strand:- start:291 stop:791 length:501 start_codon:yes stop_codon:yes gene_type:complete
MNIKNITFSCNSAEFIVKLSSSALKQIINECIKAKGNETGGILIGSYSKDGSTALLVEATARPDDSLAGRTTFQRGLKGLKSLLDKRWEAGKYYVGEWHFHPGSSPEPSRDDVESMRRISQDQNYQCKEPVMIILGGCPPLSFTLSGSVFPRGKIPVRLTQEHSLF